MKDIIKMAIIMAIFSILSALLLGFTYSKTLPLISKNATLVKDNAMKELLNEAIEFKKISIKENYGDLYEGYSEKKNLVGYIIESKAKGYGGDINYIISLTADLLLKKAKILSHKETPGLGSKIEDDKFINQFNNLKGEDLYLKKDNQKGKIDAITSATISSRALTNSLRTVMDSFVGPKLANLAEQKQKLAKEQELQLKINQEKKTIKLKDGIYSGKGVGYAGQLEVNVEVKDGKIVNIITVNSSENSKYYDLAFSSITSAVISKQRTRRIDTVTGATQSSKGLLEAIENALIIARE